MVRFTVKNGKCISLHRSSLVKYSLKYFFGEVSVEGSNFLLTENLMGTRNRSGLFLYGEWHILLLFMAQL